MSCWNKVPSSVYQKPTDDQKAEMKAQMVKFESQQRLFQKIVKKAFEDTDDDEDFVASNTKYLEKLTERESQLLLGKLVKEISKLESELSDEKEDPCMVTSELENLEQRLNKMTVQKEEYEKFLADKKATMEASLKSSEAESEGVDEDSVSYDV